MYFEFFVKSVLDITLKLEFSTLGNSMVGGAVLGTVGC